MPLQLNQSATERPQLITWDPAIETEALDAKKEVDGFLSRGFNIDFEEPGAVRLIPPKLDENTFLMRVLCQNGDDRLVWDRRDKNQVKDAFLKFKELLQEGFTAYVTLADGTKGHTIKEFNPGLEEVIFETIAKAKEVVAVPKTRPG